MAFPSTLKAFRLTMKAVPCRDGKAMKAVPFTLKAFRLTMKAIPWVTLKAISRLMGSIIHWRLFRTALLILASARRRILPR